ncbi:hypothetical protein [Fibrella aquatica]|uniref:hypothetical protein n=1 Tax=Fibrella aquatica TaxID=3242487 RepID=UPI00352012AC
MSIEQQNTATELQAILDKLTENMNVLALVQQDWEEGKKVKLILRQEVDQGKGVGLAFTCEEDGSFLISTPLYMLIEETQKRIDRKRSQLAAL